MSTPPVSAHRCPACNGAGQPFRVEASPTAVVVHVRCASCGKEWQEARPAAPDLR